MKTACQKNTWRDNIPAYHRLRSIPFVCRDGPSCTCNVKQHHRHCCVSKNERKYAFKLYFYLIYFIL